MLGSLRHMWAPEAFLVSFKLETDEGLLISKVQILHHPLASPLARLEVVAAACINSMWIYRPPQHQSAYPSTAPLHDLQGLSRHMREAQCCRQDGVTVHLEQA